MTLGGTGGQVMNLAKVHARTEIHDNENAAVPEACFSKNVLMHAGRLKMNHIKPFE
jgi:hypothetical protein